MTIGLLRLVRQPFCPVRVSCLAPLAVPSK
jgi:hypothetical protein